MRRYLRSLRSEGGFTLAEMLISIGIMTTALTMVGSPLVNALRYDEEWRESIAATTTLQRATTAIAKDAINAYTVSVADGAAPVDNVTFTWDDLGGSPHTSSYALNGTNLVRTADGASTILGRNVTLVEFSRSANLLTFSLTVAAGSAGSDSKSSSHLLRSLQ